MFEFTAPPLTNSYIFIDEIARIEKEVLSLYCDLRIQVLLQSSDGDAWMDYARDLNTYAKQWFVEIQESTYRLNVDFLPITDHLKHYVLISETQKLFTLPIKVDLFTDAKVIPRLVLIEEYESYASLVTNDFGTILFDPATMDYISDSIFFTTVPALLSHIMKEAKSNGIYNDFHRSFQARPSYAR